MKENFLKMLSQLNEDQVDNVLSLHFDENMKKYIKEKLSWYKLMNDKEFYNNVQNVVGKEVYKTLSI